LTITKLNASHKDYSEEYAKEYIDPKIKETQIGMKAAHQQALEKVSEILQDLSKSATDKHNKLNMEYPAWTNTLKLIELSGRKLDGDTTRKINESFKGDQSALQVLRDV
jgi:hypothetical protein